MEGIDTDEFFVIHVYKLVIVLCLSHCVSALISVDLLVCSLEVALKEIDTKIRTTSTYA